MSDHFDFAIAGSTPLAALLAGVLARTHGAKVCHIGAFLHPLRPQRGFDISIGPITRPETWKLLTTTVPQTLRLLAEVSDTKVYERIDPLMVAQSRTAVEALAHIRNMALAYGTQAEPLAISHHFHAGHRFRDVVRVLRRPLNASLPAWLDDAGVKAIPPENALVRSQRSGPVQIEWKRKKASADCLVLAGDDAIARYGLRKDVHDSFRQISMSALLMEPVSALATSVIQTLDNGLIVYQRGSGALDCVGKGSLDHISRATALHAPAGQKLRLAGRADFQALVSRDGGPVFGGTNANGIVFLGGLGQTGLFQIPALARVLAGAADEFEDLYFALRKPGKEDQRASVAEFVPPDFSEVSA